MEKEICKAVAKVYAEKGWNELYTKEQEFVLLLLQAGYIPPPHGFDGEEAARFYAEKDWHKLSQKERDLVAKLEKGGYLIPNNPADGFVGKTA